MDGSAVAIFLHNIKKGDITLADVPELWRDAVKQALEEEGE